MESYINSYSGKIRKGKLHRKYSVENFENFYKQKIKGIFSIEQYSIGDGWYQTPDYRENMIDVFAQNQ